MLGKTIYDLAKEHLVSARQFPDTVRGLQYDANFAIRGLSLDVRRGALLKLDFLHAVSEGYYGRRKLSTAEIKQLYHGSLTVGGRSDFSDFRPMARRDPALLPFEGGSVDLSQFYRSTSSACRRQRSWQMSSSTSVALACGSDPRASTPTARTQRPCEHDTHHSD